MELTEEQKKAQAEVKVCHVRIIKMIAGSLDDGVGFPVLLFCLEQEIYRIRGLILARSADHAAEREIGGMYQ